jgi:predicted O-methyltransferase YrrM
MSQSGGTPLRRFARGLPGARALAYAIDALRPLPLPQYLPDTPKAPSCEGDIFLPPTGRTIGEAAMADEAKQFVEDVLSKMTFHEAHGAQAFYYQLGQAKYGKYWRFADLLTLLWACATLNPPQSYLEIGVWRGRSAAVVGAVQPNCEIYGFDLWVPDYIGIENPGPDFVRGELEKTGHSGKLELVSGDSRETLPAFLQRNPDLYFDLITIDGTKSPSGFALDMAHALPRLKVGGIVVSDDIGLFPRLRRVWSRATGDGRYETWQSSTGGFGVSIAIRIAQ